MSTPMDMQESQARNEFGYIGCPSVQAAPGAAVHSHVDQSSNKALPWIGTLLAGFAAGGVLVMCLLRPWDESATRAAAELRADFSQVLADVKAESRAAGTDAAIARNTVQKLEARINERR